MLLDFLSAFKKNFYLVGGTAISLHLGHRRSIDFDLFTYTKLNKRDIIKKLSQTNFNIIKIHEDIDQLHYIINGVKLTFFNYPFQIPHKHKFDDFITIPSLIDLGAMKAYALGRRAKWKDYVDLFFILNNNISIGAISERAIKYFDFNFSEKLFREQLAYHKDIDYSESIDFIISNPPSENEIREYLVEASINIQ